MTRDLDRTVTSWLSETALTIPDPVHIYPVVSARIRMDRERRPRWLRLFGSMPLLTATRFAAAVIVALFGSLLVLSVLTPQRLEEAPANVGASASPSPRATDESLSRLSSREIAPGIRKITGDGAGHDLQDVTTIAIGEDDAVWMGAPVDDQFESVIFEAGGSAERRGLDIAGVTMAFAEDGSLWVAEQETSGCGPGNEGPDCAVPLLDVLSFDGQTWTSHAGDPARAKSEPDAWMGPGEIVGGFAIGPDGTAWTLARRDGAFPSLEHLGPGGWTVHPIGDGLTRLDCPEVCSGDDTTLALTPDGTIWVSSFEIGLLRFDGIEWEVVRPLGGDVDFGVLSLAANREGILWAEVQTDDTMTWPLDRLGEVRHLARFDGDRWEVFDATPERDDAAVPDSSYRGPGGIQAVSPDGTVWLTDTYQDPETRGGHFPVSFDGQVWRTYPQVFEDWLSDPLHDPGMKLGEMGPWVITLGPDGAVWANVDASHGHRSRGGIYVIDPVAPGSSDRDRAAAATRTNAVVASEDANAVTSASVMLPSRIPDGLEHGQLDTPLGRARWVHAGGDRSSLPWLENPVVAPSGGFIVFDGWRPAPLLWRSSDLITWEAESLPFAADHHGLTQTDGTYWLYGVGPGPLWRSRDTLDWNEVRLDELIPPGHEGDAWQIEAGVPVAHGGVTIVPLTYVTDHDTTSLGLPRIGDGLRLTGVGPNVFSLDNAEGHQATIRFEEIGSGLRVMDADDGDVELAVLDGVSMEFIERWAAGEPGIEFRAHATIDEDGSISADFPDPLVQDSTGPAFLVDASGFVAVDVADGLIHVRHSTNGRDWTETDIVGDDPGEPMGIRGVWNPGRPWLVSEDDRWVSFDGVSWRARPAMTEYNHDIPIASGWLRWSSRDPDAVQDGIVTTIAYQPDGNDPIPFDVSDMAITAPQGFGGTSLNAISSNSVVWTQELDGEERSKEIWIITFDDLPA